MAQFARTWRPQGFEDAIGQELVISILRNSLYRDSLFPVYLFIGQRGCGKTTLARIFSAAINCERRHEFSQRPHEVIIPCKSCVSCVAMHKGDHTDFSEIDAASHTGVDNVRALIEATALYPQMGYKKIYLIDEVHMLSRAAANALLKTLEEPLDSVIFLLATTDPHKIIDTVRSRCFQLFLKPLTCEQIVIQLTRICTKEGFNYDQEGLLLLARSAEGSLRDAINMLERTVIAYGRVHGAEVASLIGMITISEAIDIVEALGQQDVAQLLQVIRSAPLVSSDIATMLRMLYELLRAMVFLHHGVVVPEIVPYEDRVRSLLVYYSQNRVLAMWDAIQSKEQSILKSGSPRVLWELLLMQLCQKHDDKTVAHETVSSGEKISSTSSNSGLLAKAKQVVAPPIQQKKQTEDQNFSGEALWDRVMAHMNDNAQGAAQPKTVTIPKNFTSPQQSPSRTPTIVHDDMTKKMLALFPGTLTQEPEKGKL